MAEETLCPKCNAVNPVGTSFCSKCGTALGGTTDGEKTDPFIGSFVGERFLVKQKLGEGGMGVVYEAEQTAMDRKVALKVLHPHLNDDELYARFRNEAAASSKLEHPNIITVYDFGRTENDSLYIAMEFIDGKSLDDEIKQNGAMAWQRACKIGSQICSALRNAHEKNIIHRDMKPENVMLCKRGDDSDFVKVLDFGIAKLLDDGGDKDQRKALTKTGMVFGTPQYMSPEQVRGEKLDARSDIYSVGIIMYEMLTGSIPFSADTPMGLLTKHLMEAPPSFQAMNSSVGVPPEVEALVMAALAKGADQRPQTMKNFGQELDRMIGVEHSGKTTVASAVSPGAATKKQAASATMPMPATSAPTPVVRPKSSSPVLGVVAGVLVLLLAGGAAAWYFLMGPGKGTPMDTTVPSTGSVETVPTSGNAGEDNTPPAIDDVDAPPGPDSLSANPEGDIVSKEPSSSSGGGSSRVQKAKQLASSGNINNVNLSDDQKKKLQDAAQSGKVPGNVDVSNVDVSNVKNLEDAKELAANLNKASSGRCAITDNRSKDSKSVARALKVRQTALKKCIEEGSDSSSFSFSLAAGSKKLSSVSISSSGSNAQANCLKRVLSGMKLSSDAESGGSGTVTFTTQKSGEELSKCVGRVKM